MWFDVLSASGGHLARGDGVAALIDGKAQLLLAHCSMWLEQIRKLAHSRSDLAGVVLLALDGGEYWLARASIRGGSRRP
jgi:hypothetical protein